MYQKVMYESPRVGFVELIVEQVILAASLPFLEEEEWDPFKSAEEILGDA